MNSKELLMVILPIIGTIVVASISPSVLILIYRLGSKNGYENGLKDGKKSRKPSPKVLSPPSIHEPHIKIIWGKLRIYLWLFIGTFAIILILGVLWFKLDKPKPVTDSFYVTPAMIEGYSGDTYTVNVRVQFHSLMWTTLWLRIANGYYWIERPLNVSDQEEIKIDFSNFSKKINCRIQRTYGPVRFELKDRNGGVWTSNDLVINILKEDIK